MKIASDTTISDLQHPEIHENAVAIDAGVTLLCYLFSRSGFPSKYEDMTSTSV